MRCGGTVWVMQTLHTNQCTLEPLRESHAAEMYALLRDPRIYEFLNREPPASAEALAERYRRLESRKSEDGVEQWLNWIIRLPDSGACAGFVQATLYSVHAGDVGFILGPEHWGRGLAFAAMEAMLESLFSDYGVKSLFATADRQNLRSVTLLARLGFRQVNRALYPHGEVLPGDEVFRLDATVAKA